MITSRDQLANFLDIHGEMLLLDSVRSESADRFRSTSCISRNSAAFRQHRPTLGKDDGNHDEGLFPGVLTCEIMAQTAQYGLLTKMPMTAKKVLLHKIDVTLTAPVRPGKVEALAEVLSTSDSMIHVRVRALQNSRIVALGTLYYS